MESILETLDDKLQQYWLEQETKKTWEEWMQWLQDLDCPLNLDRPLDIPDRPFSFRTMFTASEPQLRQHSDWMTRLTTPTWLRRQQIVIMPNLLKRGNVVSPAVAEVSALQVELTRLIDQIHMVQQRMGHLEASSQKPRSVVANIPVTAPVNPQMTPKPQVVQQQVRAPISGMQNRMQPQQRPPSPMGKPDLARTLERELQIINSTAAISSTTFTDEEENKNEPEIMPLYEAYLSYNSWCDQFMEVNLNLQEFIKGELRVPSSHQISFKQFRHRILREANDPDELTQVLESFSRLRKDGVDINIKGEESIKAEAESAPIEIETEQTGFVPPSLDEYKTFNNWLAWLKENEIDPDQYTSKELGNSSSHQISYPQFCKRLERQLEDPEGFREAVGRELS